MTPFFMAFWSAWLSPVGVREEMEMALKPWLTALLIICTWFATAASGEPSYLHSKPTFSAIASAPAAADSKNMLPVSFGMNTTLTSFGSAKDAAAPANTITAASSTANFLM